MLSGATKRIVLWAVLGVALVVAVGIGGRYLLETGPRRGLSGEAGERTFDGQEAYEYALDQCAIGPRPVGSEAGWATGDYIVSQLKQRGWEIEAQEFEYRGVSVRNIVGKFGRGPVVILGAHYDTRPVADRDPEHLDEPITGGNDGASGVAVLLELAAVLPSHELENEVWLTFFDAEDRGRLEGWPWAVGSSYMAERLTVEPEYVVVVDMVGDTEQELYYERNSDAELRERLWGIAAELGYEQFIPQERHRIIDDHLPFAQRGIPAVDIIDFNYPYWHTIEDTCDKISPESLERVGRVLEEVLTRG